MSEGRARYRQLVDELGAHDRRYYVEMAPVISDTAYDALYRELKELEAAHPDWIEPAGHRMGLAFQCSSPGDVDATHARVIAAGFRSKKDPWDAFWGQRYAQVMDPDDNAVDLFAPLPTPTI